jgi:hypothetical protein
MAACLNRQQLMLLLLLLLLLLLPAVLYVQGVHKPTNSKPHQGPQS